jgi:HAD superfamily hydrolase (TIGR01509 family)
MGGDKLLGKLLGLAPDDPAVEALSGRAVEVFMELYLGDLKATNGARDLLTGFKAAGLRTIVATSAQAHLTDALLKQAGVADLIDDTVTSSEAPSSKPDPDIVQQALQKAGAVDGQVVLVGDTPYDIEAAHAAGIRAVALRCGGWWDDAALRQAVAIYNDPADMQRTLAHLLKPA